MIVTNFNSLYSAYASLYDRTGQARHGLRMVAYARDLWRTWGLPDARVLELACGTGSAAIALARRGHAVHGVDASAAMLEVARGKAARHGLPDLPFSCQDVRALDLGSARFDAVTCFYDSLNYLLTPEDLALAFERARAHVEPGASFLFDLTTVTALRDVWGDGTDVRVEPDVTRIWRSSFDPGTGISQLDATYFVRHEADAEAWRRVQEVHRQRGYDPDQVTTLLARTGWDLLAAYRCGTTRPADPLQYRVAYLAKARPVV